MSSYYDIDEVLFEQENVPVEHTDIFNPEQFDYEWKEDLPLYLAEKLVSIGYVESKLPKVYGNSALQTIVPDPIASSLRSVPFFYEIGTKTAKLKEDENLKDALLNIYVERFKGIVDRATNSRYEDQYFVEKLTNSEKKLYKQAYKASNDLENWKSRKLIKISSTAPTGKRKRSEYF